MTGHTPLEKILSDDRFLTGAGLVLILLPSWWYLLSGAGIDMDPLDSIRFNLFPYQMTGMNNMMPETADMPGDVSLRYTVIVFTMWWIMMIAMMVPAASPVILLYSRIIRHNGLDHYPLPGLSALVFLGGYLVAWMAFSILATGMHLILVSNQWLSMFMLTSNGWLAAGILFLAGIYQLTPLKHACLDHCRSPVQFITTCMKPGLSGAFQMGITHGCYCVGCCWVLMLLLFVGGVMNLLWITLLALFVLAEKVLPGGQRISAISGAILVTWSILTLLSLLYNVP